MTALDGVAALTGPPVAGVVVDWVGERGLALYLAGGIMCLAAFLYLLSYIDLRSRVKSRQVIMQAI